MSIFGRCAGLPLLRNCILWHLHVDLQLFAWVVANQSELLHYITTAILFRNLCTCARPSIEPNEYSVWVNAEVRSVRKLRIQKLSSVSRGHKPTISLPAHLKTRKLPYGVLFFEEGGKPT